MKFQVEKDAGIIPQILTQILDGSVNGITLSDPDKEDNPIVYANKAFEQITGYSNEETVGRNCRFLHKNGELFYNRLSITPLFDNDGHLIYFLGIQYDVTEQILAQQEIKKLTEALNELHNQ